MTNATWHDLAFGLLWTKTAIFEFRFLLTLCTLVVLGTIIHIMYGMYVFLNRQFVLMHLIVNKCGPIDKYWMKSEDWKSCKWIRLQGHALYRGFTWNLWFRTLFIILFYLNFNKIRFSSNKQRQCGNGKHIYCLLTCYCNVSLKILHTGFRQMNWYMCVLIIKKPLFICNDTKVHWYCVWLLWNAGSKHFN